MLRVSLPTSTKTGTAPRTTYTFAVLTNVNDGMIPSSPGATPQRMAAVSGAAVWVGGTRLVALVDCNCSQRCVTPPLPSLACARLLVTCIRIPSIAGYWCRKCVASSYTDCSSIQMIWHHSACLGSALVNNRVARTRPRDRGDEI